MLAAREIAAELVTLKTAGDKHTEDHFQPTSARTLFTHELEMALLKNKADVAVHAFPDVTTDATPGLVLPAVLPRDDPRDVLVLNSLFEGTSLADLPRGTRVGTSSLRCRGLLAAMYPDLDVVHLRGDLPTRLRKVDDGQVHATIVSAAALHRLDISQRIAGYLESPQWLPVPAQGAIVLQAREDDSDTCALAASFNDGRAAIDTAAERALLAALEGGLQSPVSALVLESGSGRVLHGAIVDPEGRHLLRGELNVDDAHPGLIGVRLANDLRNGGASRILDAVRGAARCPTPQPDR